MTEGIDDGARPKISAGEQPLLAFVSSIMREAVEAELLPSREQVVRIFRRAASLFDLWAFEFTPASSERVDRGYLRKVRVADLVLWLVGRETTPAVADEVREALAANRRLIVVRLPAEMRSEATEALQREVGLRAKYADVGGPNTLADVLSLTIGDEIIRAMRGRPDLGHMERLEELGRASRGRCLDRWRANGLSYAEAEGLFRDTSLGALGRELCTGESRVVLLVGDMGAGKSLIGERFLQAAIAHAAARGDAPIPVYLAARDAAGHLHAAAHAAAEGLGNPRVQGAAIVVDGLDEAGMDVAEPLLREARVLAETWPQTTIVLTSRPMPALDRASERVDALSLTEAEAIALIGRVAGRELPEAYILSLPPSVRPAVRRPLFAVLVGVYLRERGVTHPRSSADLLDTLVERAVGRSALDRVSADTLLHRLAVASTARGGVPVPATEVGTREEVAQLLETRLVAEHDRALDFPLPLLTQWFAAQALIADLVSPEDLAWDEQRLEYWRYPLALLAGTAGHEIVTRVLTPVAVQSPAFTAEVVHEALPERWGRQESVHLPTANECGQRLYAAMSAWTQGVGPLAPHIAPLRADGTVATVATAVGTDGDLMVSWYRGQEALPDSVPLSQYYTQDTAWRDGWPELRIAQPVPQPAWAWQWTLDKLVGETKRVVEQHALPLPEGPLRKEAIWRLALKLKGWGPFRNEPISLADLEGMLIPFARDARVIFNGMDIDPRQILFLLAQLRAVGMDEIHPPWPGPDLPEEERQSNWVWAPYTDAQLLARVQAIYVAALHGYPQIVAAWFPKFAPHLHMARRLPLRLVGIVQPQRANAGLSGGPVLWYEWERLPNGRASEANIRLIRSDEMAEDGSAIRPAVPEDWHALTDIYEDTPATDLAYDWLASDLRRVRWM